MGLKNYILAYAGILMLTAIVLSGCGLQTEEGVSGPKWPAKSESAANVPDETENAEPVEIVVDKYPFVESEADRRIFEADSDGYIIGQKPVQGDHPIDRIIEEADTELMMKLFYSDDYQDCMKVSAARLDYVKSDAEKEVILFNDKYYDALFRKEQYTAKELREIIEKNEKIPGDIRDFTVDFTEAMLDYYSNLETRIYAYNLEKLKVVYLDEEKIKELAGNENSQAYFDCKTQVIAIPRSLDLNSEKYRIMMRHELGHMFSVAAVKWDLYTVYCKFSLRKFDTIWEETLDCVLTYLPYQDKMDWSMHHLGYSSAVPYTYRILADSGYDPSEMVGSNFYECCDKIGAISGREEDSRAVLSNVGEINKYIKYLGEKTDYSVKDPRAECWDQVDGSYRQTLRALYGYLIDLHQKNSHYDAMSDEDKALEKETFLRFFQNNDQEIMRYVIETIWDEKEENQ